MRIPETKADRLFTRACAIQDRTANGFYSPILWHLALRGHHWGMSELSGFLDPVGKLSDAWSAAGLNRRAWRAGFGIAARNQAMTHFNRRDLAGYRRWLGRAAQAGDTESAAELKRFEMRLWHGAARKIGRHRPELPHDGFWPEKRLERRRAAMRVTRRQQP